MVYRKNKRAGAYTTPEANRQKVQLKDLFKMDIKGVGEVPMMFYIPDIRARDKLRPLIEEHGGIIVNQYEAYVYQIKPTRGLRSGSLSNEKYFYKGYVYNSDWIKDSIKKKMLLDEEEYLCGFNKSSKLSIIKKSERRTYNITEVLKVFDLVSEYGGSIKKMPPMKFWQEMEALNHIPDRSAASLRTAYKKFGGTRRAAFVRAVYKKASSRFSHQFEDTPDSINFDVPQTVKKIKDSCVKNLDKIMNSASTKESVPVSAQKVELEEPSLEMTPQVDMNVMTNPPSMIADNESVEFVLEVEDMQSAISKQLTGDSSYNLKTTRKRNRIDNLDDMYTGYDENLGHKRVKISEADPKVFEFTDADNTIFDQDSLLEHLSNEAQIKITSNVENGERTIESKVTNKDSYFLKITEELDRLCTVYDISMDEMHALFMSA